MSSSVPLHLFSFSPLPHLLALLCTLSSSLFLPLSLPKFLYLYSNFCSSPFPSHILCVCDGVCVCVSVCVCVCVCVCLTCTTSSWYVAAVPGKCRDPAFRPCEWTVQTKGSCSLAHFAIG